jgi:hypothetical protein
MSATALMWVFCFQGCILGEDMSSNVATGRRIHVDTWAIGIAMVLAALIRFGLLKSVPW